MTTFLDAGGDDGFPPLTPKEIKEQKKIDKLRSQVEQLNPKTKKKPLCAAHRKRINDALDARVSEFLDAFLIVGFDNSGQSTMVLRCKADMEERAIKDLVQEFITRSFIFDSESVMSSNIDEKIDPQDDDDD